METYTKEDLMNLNAKQPLPAWFDGVVIPQDEEITNGFSGETYTCNPLEVAMYDLCRGSEIIASMGEVPEPIRKESWEVVRKCLSWFRQYSPEAYMVLLD